MVMLNNITLKNKMFFVWSVYNILEQKLLIEVGSTKSLVLQNLCNEISTKIFYKQKCIYMIFPLSFHAFSTSPYNTQV